MHSVVFGGFAANELAARIDDARPRLVVSASCGIEAGRVIRAHSSERPFRRQRPAALSGKARHYLTSAVETPEVRGLPC